MLGNCSMCYTHIIFTLLMFYCSNEIAKTFLHVVWYIMSSQTNLCAILSMVTYCADFVFPCKSDLLNKHINRQSMIVDKNTVSKILQPCLQYITIVFRRRILVRFCTVLCLLLKFTRTACTTSLNLIF